MTGSNSGRHSGKRGWFKSSFSQGSDECVEVKMSAGRVAVRDSKNPNGPTLTGLVMWSSLITTIKDEDVTRD
jgi:hypothetical protein